MVAEASICLLHSFNRSFVRSFIVHPCCRSLDPDVFPTDLVASALCDARLYANLDCDSLASPYNSTISDFLHRQIPVRSVSCRRQRTLCSQSCSQRTAPTIQLRHMCWRSLLTFFWPWTLHTWPCCLFRICRLRSTLWTITHSCSSSRHPTTSMVSWRSGFHLTRTAARSSSVQVRPHLCHYQSVLSPILS